MKIRFLVMTEIFDPGDEVEADEPVALFLIETGQAVAVDTEPVPEPSKAVKHPTRKG